MSNTHNWGGQRDRAGRKSNNQLQLARASMDDIVTLEGWHTLWQTLFDIATTDDNSARKIQASRLLCEYRYGKPAPTVEYINIGEPAPEPEPPPNLPPMPPPESDDYPAAWSKTVLCIHHAENPAQQNENPTPTGMDAGTAAPGVPPRRTESSLQQSGPLHPRLVRVPERQDLLHPPLTLSVNDTLWTRGLSGGQLHSPAPRPKPNSRIPENLLPYTTRQEHPAPPRHIYNLHPNSLSSQLAYARPSA